MKLKRLFYLSFLLLSMFFMACHKVEKNSTSPTCDTLIQDFIVAQKFYNRYIGDKDCDVQSDSIMAGFKVFLDSSSYSSASMKTKSKNTFYDFIDNEDLCILSKIYKYAYPDFYPKSEKIRKFSEELTFCTQNKKIKQLTIKLATISPSLLREIYNLRELKDLTIHTINISDRVNVDTTKLRKLNLLDVNDDIIIWKYAIKHPRLKYSSNPNIRKFYEK